MARVNEIYDLNTVKGRISILKFHTPQDGVLQKHLAGYFLQHRRWMYGGMDIMMIPVATLPLDPLGVSYGAGEPTADPRDVINPILHRYYHGEKLSVNFDFETQAGTGGVGAGLVDPNGNTFGASLQEGQVVDTPQFGGSQLYANTLMDTSWRKSHLQKGFKVSCRPYVYPMMANHQIGEISSSGGTQLSGWGQAPWPNIALGNPSSGIGADLYGEIQGGQGSRNYPTSEPGFPGSPAGGQYVATMYEAPHANQQPPIGSAYGATVSSTRYQNMFTAGLRPMGWMDTEPFLLRAENSTGPNIASTLAIRCPLVYMYTTMLPPAFKQNLYFRLIISHKVAFKGYRSTQGLSGLSGGQYVPATPAQTAGTVIHDTPFAMTSIEVENAEISKMTDGVVDE